MSLDKERDFRPAPVLFLSSGKQFVTIERGRAVFWDAKDGARGKTVELKELKSVRTVAISTDGKRIANVDFMGEGLMLWDLETGQRKLHLEAEFPNNYGNICFAQDLRRVAGEVPGKTKDKFSAVPPGVFPLE